MGKKVNIPARRLKPRKPLNDRKRLFGYTTMPRLIAYLFITLSLFALHNEAIAQQQRQLWFTYQEKGVFESITPIKLEVTAFEPKEWNGKIIVINHGSTGNDSSKIKFTWKFLKLNKALTEHGFRTFVLMRKGRGASEGSFTEENHTSCSYNDRMHEVAEAEPQLDQFIDRLRTEYKVEKIILFGHSRGGYLSSYYGARHQDKVAYAVNISGGWATQCEHKSGQTLHTLKETAATWKNQLWVYSTNDKYFSNDQINDYKTLADKMGIAFIMLETTEGEGHSFAYSNPQLWLDKAIQLFMGDK